MNKILSILISFSLVVVMFYFLDLEEENPDYSKIKRIIDGDTLEIENGKIIRLSNINSLEKNQKDSNLSKAFLENLVGKDVEVKIDGKDKYGRYLAKIYYNDKYLNLELIKQGFSSTFLVNEEEKKAFFIAQKEAIDNEKGIWKKSDKFGCLEVEVKEKEEYFIITNYCNDFFINNWYFKDESRKKFLFPNLSLREIKVFTHKSASEKDLSLNQKLDIWNNDKDSIFIFDEGGNLVHYESYGY